MFLRYAGVPRDPCKSPGERIEEFLEWGTSGMIRLTMKPIFEFRVSDGFRGFRVWRVEFLFLGQSSWDVAFYIAKIGQVVEVKVKTILIYLQLQGSADRKESKDKMNT